MSTRCRGIVGWKVGGPSRPARPLAVLAALWIQACIPDSPRTRQDVSDRLRERVGQGLRPQSGRADEAQGQTAERVPEPVDLSDGLSDAEAVAVALWNNGGFQATLADLGFARGELTRAGVLPNPIFSSFLPLGPKQFEFNIGWGLAWLWQRAARVEVASLRMEQVAESLVQAGLDVARDARVAHAAAVAADERRRLSQEAAATWLEIARLMRVRVEVGMSSQLELSAVEVDVRGAQIEAARQVRGAELARVNLRRVLGLTPGTAIGKLAPAPIVAQLPARPALLKAALAARPDLRAAELTIEAEAARAGLEAREAYQFTAQLDANAEGREGFELGPGVIVPIPLFDRNQAGRQNAKAALEQAAWRYVAVRQTIVAEVDGAALRLAQALEALQQWPGAVLAPAKRNVELAKKAFAAGGASYLSVLDSTRVLQQAQLRQVDLKEDARRAHADLARGVGTGIERTGVVVPHHDDVTKGPES